MHTSSILLKYGISINTSILYNTEIRINKKETHIKESQKAFKL